MQRHLLTGIRLSVTAEKGAAGDVSPFAALTTALAATIGTGNIVGVATAVSLGGPGAVLWMWLTGVLGMATRDEVARLQQRVRALEQEVERASKAAAAKATTASTGTTRSRASRSTATPAKPGTAKPSTRTRTAGASTRSTATSPATRRKKSTGSGDSGSTSAGSA